MSELTKDSLEAWRAHPVTEHLLGALRDYCKALKKDAQEQWWETGEVDGTYLVHIKAREALVVDLMEASVEDFDVLEGQT